VIRVGPAGWSYSDWEGSVYPRRKPPGFHALAALATTFDCVEIDSTFYAPARTANAMRWVELVRDRPTFRFTAKLQDVFTHRPLASSAEFACAARDYLEGVEPLFAANKLAAVLVQLPHSAHFGSQEKERLAAISNAFGHLRLVLEPRHTSWCEPEALLAIEAARMSLAWIDLPYAKDHPPAEPPRTGPIGYLRLHGRNTTAWFSREASRDQRYAYLYSKDEVAEIVRRTRRLAEGVDETFVVTNNHFGGKAVVNALEILAGVTGERVPAFPEIVAAFPRLAECTHVLGQQRLW
jgi:uncharacterized protein YecE (DUF72 family)